MSVFICRVNSRLEGARNDKVRLAASPSCCFFFPERREIRSSSNVCPSLKSLLWLLRMSPCLPAFAHGSIALRSLNAVAQTPHAGIKHTTRAAVSTGIS